METNLHYPTTPEDAKYPGPPKFEYYEVVADALGDNPDNVHLLPYSQIPGATQALKTSNLHKAMQTRGLRISVVKHDAEHLAVVRLADNAPLSRRGRKRSPIYDRFAAAMREQPNTWFELAFSSVPGRTIAIKTSGLITNLRTRGLRVTLRRIDDLRTYVRILEDYEAGAQ